ncbi:MAG: amino acid adenylation domain-containing protein [Janthinobacterium lividum]
MSIKMQDDASVTSEATEAPAFDPFASGAIAQTTAATEAQREVWLADQLGPQASLAYNESLTLRLQGSLDSTALAGAFDALVERHPSLRTTFSSDGSQLLIAEPAPLQLSQYDLRTHDATSRQRIVDADAHAAVRERFELDRGPLFRAALYRLSTLDNLLLMTAHHAVCDGWSWGVIAEDLGHLYAERVGAGPSLDPAPAYADYVAWEVAEADGPEMKTHVDYWVSKFSGGSLPVLELPLDRPRPAVRTFASQRIEHVLERSLIDALRKTGSGAGASLYAALFSGFAALLHRLSAQDDLVIGIAAAGQMAANMPRLVGHCVNLLPLRVAIDGTLSFDALMRQSGSQLLDAFEHQNLTYGTLLRKLPMTRDPSRLPLVSVLFNVDRDAAPHAGSFPDIEAEQGSVARAAENFELFVNIVPVATGMKVELQYNTDLFDAATIVRWLQVYECLLRSAVRDPACSVGRLDLLSAAEAHALTALQPAPRPLAGLPLMHAAFCDTAAAAPGRNALRYGRTALTYGELDTRSNRLARALRERGVQRGALVGLCLPRDADMVVALLAVLKAGATYVPLDPDFPQARLDYYAEDARLALLLTVSSVHTAPTHWCADAADRTLVIDTDRAWMGQPADALAASGLDAGAHDPAYVIYTSGSTGQPKGVAVPHGAVANFLQSMRREPGLAADDVLVAVTTLSFDIAVLELMLPLAVGAEVVIASRDVAVNGTDLGALLHASGATAMQATPGMWRLLLDAGWHRRGPFKALVGGESLPSDLAQLLLRAAGEVWNMYGPTETTIWSTVWRVDLAQIGRGGISIGKPIDNTTVWVLDDHLRPLPVGVPGELCIGGDGVALGYLDRPELTADRFVTVDIDGAPSRIYRTGDRGRWRNDGQLVHLGRNDHQVKVRGYRIELGEIETRCNEAPGIARSVVVVREDQSGDARLVAYLVPAAGATLDRDALAQVMQSLRTRLPQYMLPQHLVPLAAIPLLPNGKVDRRALPPPASLLADGDGTARVAPRNDRERIVLETMEKVLHLPGLSIHDDFFALGGHSLLAARLAALLGTAFDVPLPMRVLFESPTAERLAQAIDGLARSDVPRRKPVVHVPRRRDAPLTPMQARIRFIEELHPGRSVYNQPSTHRFGGPLDAAMFESAFRTIVSRQSALRTSMGTDPQTGAPCQVVVPTLDFDFPVIDLSVLPEAQREGRLQALLRETIDLPLDIHRGPLFRVALYRMAADDHAFVFVPHHLIWDGWSFDLYQAELSALYGALVRGEAPLLPVLPVTMADHAQWYAEWLGSPEAQAQLRFWKSRFAAAPAPRAARTDRPRKAGMSGQGGTHWIRIDKALTERLREVARQHDVTLNMLALGVYVLMMASVIDTDALVVATPVRGREQPEVETVMGFFNNVLPMAFRIDRAAGLGGFMRYVKQELLAVMNNQQIPFERLVAEPEFAERAQGVGLYQALFSFQDARERPLDFGGLTHKQIHILQSGATDDLGMWLMEKPHGLEGAVTYNADIYLPETGEAFKDRYVELMHKVAAQPAALIATLIAPEGSSSAARLARLAATAAEPVATPDAAPNEKRAAAPMALLPPEQARLAQLWACALDVDVNDIRASDNFFDLGGDSLQAMRAVELSEQTLGFRIEPRRYVFESLSQLAVAPSVPAAADGESEARHSTGRDTLEPERAAKRGGLLGRMFSGLGRKG